MFPFVECGIDVLKEEHLALVQQQHKYIPGNPVFFGVAILRPGIALDYLACLIVDNANVELLPTDLMCGELTEPHMARTPN